MEYGAVPPLILESVAEPLQLLAQFILEGVTLEKICVFAPTV
jgi:hypothetical protein